MKNITLIILISLCIVYIILSFLVSRTKLVENNKCFEDMKKLCDNNMNNYMSLVILLFVSTVIVYLIADNHNYVCLYENRINDIDAVTRIKNLI